MFLGSRILEAKYVQMKEVSESDTFSLLVIVFRSISKSSKVQLYIIIMKPFREVAGGNHLPAICYAQTGGMAYLGDYHYSKEHWQGQSLGWFCGVGERRQKDERH